MQIESSNAPGDLMRMMTGLMLLVTAHLPAHAAPYPE